MAARASPRPTGSSPVNGVRLAERQVGTRLLEVAGQARHVPAQAVVAQQVVHQLLQLGALLRAHAGEQRRHLRRLAVQVLDQLVDAADVRREVVAVARHEPVEVGPRVGAAGVLLQQGVEVADHVADARQVLRRDLLDALAEPGEVRLQHLLPQLVAELAERVARGVVHELVVGQAVEPAGRIVGQRVEAVAMVLSGAAQYLLRQPRGVLLGSRRRVERRTLSLADAALQAFALEPHHLRQAIGDPIQHPAQLAALQLLAAPGAQPLDDVAEPRHVAAACCPACRAA